MVSTVFVGIFRVSLPFATICERGAKKTALKLVRCLV